MHNKLWMINTAINRQYSKNYHVYNHHIKINKKKFKPNQVKIIKTLILILFFSTN